MRNQITHYIKSADRRFPFFRDLLRVSPLLRRLLGKAGIVPARVLRSHEGFFPVPAARGFPKFFTFKGAAPAANASLLFGVTHDHAALQGLQSIVVVADRDNQPLLRCTSSPLAAPAGDIPWAVRAMLPGCSIWYERHLGSLPNGWQDVKVSISSSFAIPDKDQLPPGFAFFCVLVDHTNAGALLTDLRHFGPAVASTAKGAK